MSKGKPLALILAGVVGAAGGYFLIHSLSVATPGSLRDNRAATDAGPYSPVDEERDTGSDSEAVVRHDSTEPQAPHQGVSGAIRASDLSGESAKNFALVNRTLRRAGYKELDQGLYISSRDLEVLDQIVESTSQQIGEAADAILDLQDPYGKEMIEKIRAAKAEGQVPPFIVLANGALPRQRNRYDLWITTAHEGVVYGMTLPYTQEVVSAVDTKLAAEALRLASFDSTVRSLFKEVPR